MLMLLDVVNLGVPTTTSDKHQPYKGRLRHTRLNSERFNVNACACVCASIKTRGEKPCYTLSRRGPFPADLTPAHTRVPPGLLLRKSTDNNFSHRNN